jgi:hypothetical protein
MLGTYRETLLQTLSAPTLLPHLTGQSPHSPPSMTGHRAVTYRTGHASRDRFQPCVPENSPGQNCTTGRLLAAERSSEALAGPLRRQFRHSPSIRCVGRNLQNRARVCVSPQSVGMEHASWTQLSHHPSLRTSTPLACMQATAYAVSHPADARHKALDGAHSQRKIRSKSWEKVTSPKKL